MQNPNILPSSRAVLSAAINPADTTGATVATGWVDMATFGALMAILSIGAADASATIDAKLQQATDSSGTGAKDIDGKAMTQLGGDDDNQQVVFDVFQSDLDVNNGFTHVNLSVTVSATNGALLSAVLLGFDARYEPATDAASVAEVV